MLAPVLFTSYVTYFSIVAESISKYVKMAYAKLSYLDIGWQRVDSEQELWGVSRRSTISRAAESKVIGGC